jgi:hypothetical protein
MPEGQRPVLIPAQGNALGFRFNKSQGLKARLNPAGDKSGFQPSAVLREKVSGALPQAGMKSRRRRSWVSAPATAHDRLEFRLS